MLPLAVQGAIRRDRELETATEGLAHSAPRGKDAELSRFDSDSEDSDGGLQTAGRGMAVEKGGKSGTGRGERAPETSDDEERGGSGDNAPGRVLEFAKGGRKGKKVDLSRFEDSDSEGEVRGGEEEDSEGEPDDNKEEDESEEYAG